MSFEIYGSVIADGVEYSLEGIVCPSVLMALDSAKVVTINCGDLPLEECDVLVEHSGHKREKILITCSSESQNIRRELISALYGTEPDIVNCMRKSFPSIITTRRAQDEWDCGSNPDVTSCTYREALSAAHREELRIVGSCFYDPIVDSYQHYIAVDALGTVYLYKRVRERSTWDVQAEVKYGMYYHSCAPDVQREIREQVPLKYSYKWAFEAPDGPFVFHDMMELWESEIGQFL